MARGLTLRTATALIDCPPAVVNFALEQHLAFRKGYDYVIEFLTGMERALWAEDQTGVLGIYLWTVHDHGRRWWIDFAAVAPQARRSGVLATMRRKFEALARADKYCRSFESHVSVKNDRMIRVALAAGSAVVSYKLRKKVKT